MLTKMKSLKDKLGGMAIQAKEKSEKKVDVKKQKEVNS